MDIRNLNTFIQAAELGSFSQAGEKLGYSQPTVSVQIRQLEEELGDRLFDRIGHAVRLTDRGRELLRYAQEICRLSQEMSGREAETGAEIRLATADSLCGPLLLDSLEGLRQACPHISLKLTTAGTDGLFRMLESLLFFRKMQPCRKRCVHERFHVENQIANGRFRHEFTPGEWLDLLNVQTPGDSEHLRETFWEILSCVSSF